METRLYKIIHIKSGGAFHPINGAYYIHDDDDARPLRSFNDAASAVSPTTTALLWTTQQHHACAFNLINILSRDDMCCCCGVLYSIVYIDVGFFPILVRYRREFAKLPNSLACTRVRVPYKPTRARLRFV